jgi:ferrous iron transport protein B
MSFVLQAVIVALLVALCALYSIWRLLSARLRLRLLDRLAAVPGIGRAAWFAALRAAALSRFAAGCAGCAPAATSAASRKQTPGALRRS